MNKKTRDGIKAYTPLSLKLYDWWVLQVSNRYAWQCDTERHLIPHFRNNMKNNHLDVGGGTGYYLTFTPDICNVSLLDLNISSLEAANARVGRKRIKESILHDVFDPYPSHLREQFDSVSMFYLLHCLPGEMHDKARVIAHASNALTKEGCLYGATILGDDAGHNRFGRKLMRIYNQKGIFSNRTDSAEALASLLSRYFCHVELLIEGRVALFKAERKKEGMLAE
ncbi:class I SAM-dependent methyltransferase [Enterobacter ludwigii]|uniref:class I SAM-dependent methyltransferase n=1 Tax=Enterobacter ludwigii TaxID=299767 RepID=UPI0005CFD4F5|nr:class I SAM-dependent methyltransferase [Enterobacter ludwigii]MED5734005.1 class I SAM-dependent methyltransferase [Enterobacter ludwigii]MRI48566.1 class I SAM-dependent methyltransferase [Enterobacter ludwigii]HDR2456674.1 class I SAM-dependent methyltransferase [Enterobacter ludwigii]HDR2552302.1 class I SAM-dependent methyltransferase [Enterobacter ludwigii]HDR2556869.1 class I SAM-dependent methyltransferase [Enterobacter ludwigii]